MDFIAIMAIYTSPKGIEYWIVFLPPLDNLEPLIFPRASEKGLIKFNNSATNYVPVLCPPPPTKKNGRASLVCVVTYPYLYLSSYHRYNTNIY